MPTARRMIDFGGVTLDPITSYTVPLLSGELLHLLDLPEAALPKISDQEIKAALTDVFDWPNSSAYAFYLNDLPPRNLNISARKAKEVDTIAQKNQAWSPYDIDKPNAMIQLSVPPSMRGLPANYQICVVLDSIGVPAPVDAAHIVSASFHSALVAHTILHLFGKTTLDLDAIQVTDLLVDQKAELVNNYGATPDSYRVRLQVVAAQTALQAAGFFLGWKAAGDLTNAEAAVSGAVWRLMQSRFSWAAFGELTSYGLSYLLGFLRVQAVLRAANTKPNTGADKRVDFILSKLKDDKNIAQIENVVSAFFDSLISTFLKATTEKATSESKREAVLERYRYFLSGYQRGSLRASEEIFASVLQLAYGIGYSDGFRVGYARGYADGYKAGYDAGYDAAGGRFFDNLLQFTGDLVQVTRNVASVVAVFAG